MNNNKEYKGDKISEYQKLLHLRSRYEAMEDKREKVALIEECVALADKLDDTFERINIRWDLMWAYEYGGDPSKLIPTGSEFLALLEQNPKAFSGTRAECTIIAISMMQATAMSLPQIPKEQCFALLQEFHQKVLQYKLGERLWHDNACFYYTEMDDMEKLAYHLEKFLATPRDRTSDCKVCEISNAAEHLFNLGRQQEALQEVEKLLKENNTCESQPYSAICSFVHDFLDKGELENAQKYGKELFGKPIRYANDLTYAATLLRLEASTANGYWADTVLFERCMQWVLDIWEKELQLEFYIGAGCYLTYLTKRQPVIQLSLPSKFELYRKDGNYDCLQLQDWFWKQAKSIADAFDARNGNQIYNESVEEAQKSMEIFLDKL